MGYGYNIPSNDSSGYQKLIDSQQEYINKLLGKKSENKTACKVSGNKQDLEHQICKYLEEHPEIEDFVILDDNQFEFKDFEKLWERLLITDGIERVKFASNTPAIETIIFRDYIRLFS